MHLDAGIVGMERGSGEGGICLLRGQTFPTGENGGAGLNPEEAALLGRRRGGDGAFLGSGATWPVPVHGLLLESEGLSVLLGLLLREQMAWDTGWTCIQTQCTCHMDPGAGQGSQRAIAND